MKKTIFYYAILLQPTADEAKAGKSTEMLVPPTAILAHELSSATIIAGRAIPEAHLENLDRVEVAVTPF